MLSYMKWFLKPLLFVLCIAFISCGKEHSYELPLVDSTGIGNGGNGGTDGNGGSGNTGGTAAFTLIPSGTNCSDAAIAGDLITGTALGLNAQFKVTVNVTQVGDWTMNTNTVDGILFAGAGTFTATGAQQIILQGVGIPLTAGIITVPFKAGSNICTTTAIVLPGGTGGGSASGYYYKIVIDGKTIQQAAAADNNYIPGSSLSADGTDASFTSSIEYYAGGPSGTPLGETNFRVTIGTMHNYDYTTTNNVFKAFFPVTSYTVRKSLTAGNGVILSWTDASGVEWSTANGDQTGSTFSITSESDEPDPGGNFYLKAVMQFTCKLYNSSGTMKQVTSGEMTGLFGKL